MVLVICILFIMMKNEYCLCRLMLLSGVCVYGLVCIEYGMVLGVVFCCGMYCCYLFCGVDYYDGVFFDCVGFVDGDVVVWC